jgi:hypothetical protein
MNSREMARQERMLANTSVGIYEYQIHPDYSGDCMERYEILLRYHIDSRNLFETIHYKCPDGKDLFGSLLIAAYHLAKLLNNDQTDTPKAFDHFIARFGAGELKAKAVQELFKAEPSLKKRDSMAGYLNDLYRRYHAGEKIVLPQVAAFFKYLDRSFGSLLRSDSRLRNLRRAFAVIK